MFIRNLSISTKVRLHPEFVAAPRAFSRRHKVDLADEIFPQTDFRKDPNNPRSDERIEKIKANVHLVRHGAIRLFTKHDGQDTWVYSINLNPSMLRYEAERHVLAAGDLPMSLSILRKQVAPLLADPLDAQHIVPGLVQNGEEPVASWSEVDSEFQFSGIDIRCLHGLSHPGTGPADGATEKRIQFGDKKDDFVIRIKKAKWDIDEPDGIGDAEGIRVRLILKDQELTSEFMPFGTTAKVNDTVRLVAFSESSIALVHQAVMARMTGTCLPVPAEWRNEKDGKRVTTAKTMALVSQLTSIPFEELRAMDEEIRHPSESTSKRLRTGAAAAAACLKPVPVSSLFLPDAYANHAAAAEQIFSPQDR
jgi:hypothetical protein